MASPIPDISEGWFGNVFSLPGPCSFELLDVTERSMKERAGITLVKISPVIVVVRLTVEPLR